MATAKKKAAPKSGASEKAKKAQSARMTKQARSYQPKGQSYVDRDRERGNTGDLAGVRGPVKDFTRAGDSTGFEFQIPNYKEGRTNRRRNDIGERAYKKKVAKQTSAAKVAKGKK
jgi:hypothetical protein